MQRGHNYRSLLLAAVLFLAGATALSAQQPPGLLIEVPGGAAADQSAAGDRTRVRARTVRVDLPQLGTRAQRRTPGQSLLLNLFDDASYSATLDRIDQTRGGFVWVGHIPDVAMSTVTLAIEDGAIYGSVLTPAATYVIRSAGNGLHLVAQIDQSAFRPEADPREVDAPPGGRTELADASPPAGDDSAAFIDVMVLYTPAAAIAAGGSSAINALIANAISVTNTAYGNSNVTQRVRLAFSGPVAYTESGDIETDLNNITNGTGGLSAVAALRNTYAADMVSLLTNTPGSQFCGIAWHMSSVSSGFDPFAYSVVEQSCAVGSLAFPHELGHNMGLRHDWYVDNHTTPYSYAHGHVNVGTSSSTRWRTIMSYADKCTDQGVFCTRIPYWSNPSLSYMGSPLGVPAGTNTSCTLRNRNNPACDADEHLVLNNTAFTVANFRRMPLTAISMTPDVTFPVPTATPVSWTVAAAGGTSPYTYKFLVFDGSQWSVGQDWDASNTWTWTPSVGGTYSFQVWLRNAGSAATYDAWLGVGPVLVTGPVPLTVSAFSANLSFPVTANTPVTWTATSDWRHGAIYLQVLRQRRIILVARPGLEHEQHVGLAAHRSRHIQLPGLGAERGIERDVRCVATGRTSLDLRSAGTLADRHVAESLVTGGGRIACDLDRDGDRWHRSVHLQVLRVRRLHVDDGTGLELVEHLDVDTSRTGHLQLPGVGAKRGVRRDVRCVASRGAARRHRSAGVDDHELVRQPGVPDTGRHTGHVDCVRQRRQRPVQLQVLDLRRRHVDARK